MLLGIVGRKRNGKNTLANIIQSYNKNYVIDAFGDDLKTLVKDIFKPVLNDAWNHRSPNYLHPIYKDFDYYSSEAHKDESFEYISISVDNYLKQICQKTGLDIKPQNKIARSYRDLLTMIGTEYVRTVNDNYWVDKVMDRVKENPITYHDWIGEAVVHCNIVIADVRFRIEAEAIKKLGGKLVKIIKINHDNSTSTTDPSFTHRSETEQDGIIADLTIGSLRDNLTIPTIVGFHIANEQWEEAYKYNWNERY